ncbi:MAG: hypothetical protein NTV51_13530 [Verrucomicrobia bacterium]|nr:hypothetical protein [Verrucomicrobiota bacterium]
MPVAARPIPFLRTERAFVMAIAGFALVPVAYVLGRAFLVSSNVAYWDELDTALLLLLRLDHGATWQEVLGQLFALGNEHRTFTSRLLFATSYWTTGTVNFAIIGAIGNLFICGLCGVLVYYAGTTARRVRMGVLLAFLLFQLEHYENFQWSGASIDHFQVVLLAGASVIGLSRGTRGGWLAAVLFAILATFTLAHGIVAWAVGALMLGAERRWHRLTGWLVVGAITAAFFFYGFTFNPGHQIGAMGGGEVGRVLRYWLTLLGAPLALGVDAAAPFLGVALLALVGRALARGAFARERIAMPLALWAVGALALVAIGRADLTHGHVYSRYYVLGALAWALVLFVQFEEWQETARPYRPLLRVMPLLALFNILANTEFAHDAQSWVICRDNASEYYQRYGLDGMGRFTLHPDPAYASRLLREVEQAGIYSMPRLCKQRWFPDAKVAASLSYYVDRIIIDDQIVTIEGWAARPGQVSAPDQIHLVLQSTKTREIYTTLPMERPDVTTAHPEENWGKSGFRFQRRRWLLPAEDFQIGLLINSKGNAEFVMTAHHLDMRGKGVGILANGE